MNAFGIDNPTTSSSSQFVISDSAPYGSKTLRCRLNSFSKVIIPTRTGVADFVALAGLVKQLRVLNKIDDSMIVLNAVRRPPTKSVAEFRAMVEDDLQGCRVAITQIPLLICFEDIFATPQNSMQRKNQEKALAVADTLLVEVFTYERDSVKCLKKQREAPY